MQLRSGCWVQDFKIRNLTIQYGGPTKSDGAANGVIEDPGSLAVNTNTRSRFGSGTGLVGSLVILPLLTVFGFLF